MLFYLNSCHVASVYSILVVGCRDPYVKIGKRPFSMRKLSSKWPCGLWCINDLKNPLTLARSIRLYLIPVNLLVLVAELDSSSFGPTGLSLAYLYINGRRIVNSIYSKPTFLDQFMNGGKRHWDISVSAFCPFSKRVTNGALCSLTEDRSCSTDLSGACCSATIVNLKLLKIEQIVVFSRSAEAISESHFETIGGPRETVFLSEVVTEYNGSSRWYKEPPIVRDRRVSAQFQLDIVCYKAAKIKLYLACCCYCCRHAGSDE